MQLILLSGGSGKRLWPLSNDSYSKQFLRLLPAPDGTKESMLQRVVRQIRESGLEADVTIATGENQVGTIRNQLGDKVSIVTEPERRDTFPAIALACLYLEKEKLCDKDETVVVMPSVNRSFYNNTPDGMRFWDYISEELPALLPTFFHVSTRREDTFVAGLSMGGFGAFKLALNHPDRYAAAASLSGALRNDWLCTANRDR